MEDDLYFRYMTHGRYDPVEWGHERPPKAKLKRKTKLQRISKKNKDAEIQSLKEELKRIQARIDKLEKE